MACLAESHLIVVGGPQPSQIDVIPFFSFLPKQLFFYFLHFFFSHVPPSSQLKSVTHSDTPWHIPVLGPLGGNKNFCNAANIHTHSRTDKMLHANPTPNFQHSLP